MYFLRFIFIVFCFRCSLFCQTCSFRAPGSPRGAAGWPGRHLIVLSVSTSCLFSSFYSCSCLFMSMFSICSFWAPGPAMFWTTPKNPTRAWRVAPRYGKRHDIRICIYSVLLYLLLFGLLFVYILQFVQAPRLRIALLYLLFNLFFFGLLEVCGARRAGQNVAALGLVIFFSRISHTVVSTHWPKPKIAGC